MSKSRLFPASFLLAILILTSAQAEDEAPIRRAIASYVEAFNRGDAAAIAELWSEGGAWISPSGDRISGREAIRSEMEDYFAAGGAQIEVLEPNIRFLAPTVAVEEGVARVSRRGELPAETTYIALHVKSGDDWKLESVRETAIPTPESNYDQLKDLEWMVGTWVDQDDNATIRTTCKWTKNRNFMTRSFTLEVEGKIDLEGTQVIGYDAARGQIRSWLFDSAGGFGESKWMREGDRWIINNSQTLQDGSLGSSINIIRYIDDDTCTWESTGRELAGELLPSIQPVTVVRAVEEATESPSDGEAIDDSGDATGDTDQAAGVTDESEANAEAEVAGSETE